MSRPLQSSLAGRSQCQETGRDQAHAQMGLEFLSNTAETGWIQGVDLYRALDHRPKSIGRGPLPWGTLMFYKQPHLLSPKDDK